MDPHFFDGIDENLGDPPLEDNEAEREIPESTPAGPRYPQRIRQPAAALLSPNTTVMKRIVLICLIWNVLLTNIRIIFRLLRHHR